MDGMKCNLRRIMYEKNIKTIAEVIRLTGANRQALTRMYKNREACTISCFAVALLFGESFSIRIDFAMKNLFV